MNITIVCVGRLKEKFYRDAIDEFKKRMGAYAKLEIKEFADEGELTLTGKNIIKYLKTDERAYNIALAIEGREYDSLSFAEKIDSLMTRGVSHIRFIIGGSDGLSDEVLHTCDELLSFSKMTFPFQLMRVILIEQIYRAFRINNNEPYHK